jgi:hypothetical protein
MPVIDIKEHEDAQQRYLLAMLELTEELEQTDSRPGRLLNIGEAEIAEKAGIDAGLAFRISDELKDDLLIESQGTLAGRAHHFTTGGRRFAEELRYKKTALAKRREAAALGLSAIKEVSKSIWTNMATGAGGLIAGWFMGYHWNRLAQWFWKLFGN